MFIRFEIQDEIDDDSEYGSETTEDEYPHTYFDFVGYEEDDDDDDDDDDVDADEDNNFTENQVHIEEIRRE